MIGSPGITLCHSIWLARIDPADDTWTLAMNETPIKADDGHDGLGKWRDQGQPSRQRGAFVECPKVCMHLLYSFLRCIDTYGLRALAYGQKRRLSAPERACHARHVDLARVSPTLTPTASGHATWHTNIGAGRTLLIVMPGLDSKALRRAAEAAWRAQGPASPLSKPQARLPARQKPSAGIGYLALAFNIGRVQTTWPRTVDCNVNFAHISPAASVEDTYTEAEVSKNQGSVPSQFSVAFGAWIPKAYDPYLSVAVHYLAFTHIYAGQNFDGDGEDWDSLEHTLEGSGVRSSRRRRRFQCCQTRMMMGRWCTGMNIWEPENAAC